MYIETEKYLSHKHIQVKAHMYTQGEVHIVHIALCIHTHRPHCWFQKQHQLNVMRCFGVKNLYIFSGSI